jgi:hypothetical protein
VPIKQTPAYCQTTNKNFIVALGANVLKIFDIIQEMSMPCKIKNEDNS